MEQCHLSEKAFARNAGDALIEIIRPHLPAGSRLIDFGAGSGELSQKLIEAGFYVAAIEPASERQQSLLARIGAHEHWLGFLDDQPQGSFDAVLLVEVLEHVSADDAPSLLTRAISYLRPGGFLVITTPNNEDIKAAEAYCPDCNQLFHPWQHLQSLTYTSLLELTSLHGIQKTHLSLADFSADKEIVEGLKWHHQVSHARDIKDSATVKRMGDVQAQLTLHLQDLNEMEQRFAAPAIEPDLSLRSDREKIFSLINSLERLPWPKRLWVTVRLAKNVKPLLFLFVESYNELAHTLRKTVRSQDDLKSSLTGLRSRLRASITDLEDAQKYIADKTLMAKPAGRKAAVATTMPAPMVDNRVGKETTIVFVGQKR